MKPLLKPLYTPQIPHRHMPFSSVTDSPAASSPSLLLPLLRARLHLTAATAERQAPSTLAAVAAAAAATTGRRTTAAAEAAAHAHTAVELNEACCDTLLWNVCDSKTERIIVTAR